LLLILTIFLSPLIAQPSLNLWKNNTPHIGSTHTLHHVETNKDGTPIKNEDHLLLTCDYNGYFLFAEGSATNHYSICNNGDQTLNIQLPLQLVGTGISQMSINQPSQSSITPNSCVDFSLTYTAPATYASADFSLAIISDDPQQATCTWNYEVGVTPPANDNCTDAIPIACGDSVSSSNFGANTELAGMCSLDSDARTVFYTIVGDGSVITLSTANPGTDFDTEISVYSTTSDCTDVVCVGNNDDAVGLSSIFGFPSVPGTTYIIAVAGFSNNQGFFELSVSCSEPDTESCKENITPLCGVTSIIGTNVGANNPFNQLGICNLAPAAKMVLYSIVGDGNDITLSTDSPVTNFDTEISVLLPSSDCLEVVCIGNDDDGGTDLTSMLTFSSEAGVTYIIAVAGFSTSEGDFELSLPAIECPTASVSDPCDCENPANIKNSNGSINLFADELTFTGLGTIQCTDNCDGFLTATGSPITDFGTAPSIIPFFRQSGDFPAATFTVGGVPLTLDEGTCTDDCITIPTLSQWGLFIFSLLVLNIGVVLLKRKEWMFGQIEL